MQRVPYGDFVGLENVYLEDSYVLDIQIRVSSVLFVILAVLTEEHPEFSPPPPEQQYCYRRAELSFSDAKRIECVLESITAATDVTETVDYGNIDEFYLADGQYHLSGDWGRLAIRSTAPLLQVSVLKH